MIPTTVVGVPERSVGEKTARRAASTAAPRSWEWPLTARAEMTSPLPLTITSTATGPLNRDCRATSG